MPDAFLAAISESPEEATTRVVLADWLDDNPEAVPDAAAWAEQLRRWMPQLAYVRGVRVTEETKPLFDALVLGSARQIIEDCQFDRLDGHGLVVGPDMIARRCVVTDCGGYGFVNDGGFVSECCAVGCTAGGFSVSAVNCRAFSNGGSGFAVA